MTPYFADDWLTVYQGDCREVMASMEPASVHCVVTSPPYWGLRDYGTASWIGGDAECDHLRPVQPRNERPKGEFHGGTDDGDYAREPQWKDRCRKCGAIREDNQLGLEPTPEEYVANMVGVFREIRRVLRDDGTVWLNLGDSYVSNGRYESDRSEYVGTLDKYDHRDPRPGARSMGLKPKDLVGIPWRVAFALQADGWYLRSDIIWSKPNPMPESVTDRPTKSHEYLFLLSKSARYYFVADAVRETAGVGVLRNGFRGEDDGPTHYANQPSAPANDQKFTRPSRKRGEFNGKTESLPGRNAFRAVVSDRNIRSVWTIATQPYPGAHFATFPPKLVEPCVKAGSPQQGVVLDPFGGSGTTGMVAQHLGRRAVLIDLNGDYLVQAMRRNQQSPLGLDVA